MKKGRINLVLILSLFLLSILLISSASAVEINLSKESYQPGETLQAEIYGNFIEPLQLENIYFYRERSLPLIYDILKLKDKYLLYALLPYKEGNYTLKIKDAEYTTEEGSSTEDIIKEFKIEKTNETTITINPGFVVARNDFFIKVKANNNLDVEIEFEATGETKSVNLIQNTEKKVYFSVSDIGNYTESRIKIADYKIPVFIFPEKSEEEIIKETESFRFNPLEVRATILKEQEFSFTVDLINLGDTNISGIELSSELPEELDVEIQPDFISLLEARDEKTLELRIISEDTGDYSGKIVAFSKDLDLSTELFIDIDITENKSEVKYESPSYTEELSCSELGGKICAVNEVCDGSTEFTKDGLCCLGNCASEEKSSSSWIYGLIIIVVVLAALGILFYFMRKRQRLNIDDFLKKRETRFEERMSGRGEEVRGSLTKV